MILTVSLSAPRYSSRLMCARCGLTASDKPVESHEVLMSDRRNQNVWIHESALMRIENVLVMFR
jgi:hypothetical protein